MTFIIAGGRNYQERPGDREWLDEVAGNATRILSGGASGADTLGERWAISRLGFVDFIPANWERDGKAAGPIRNQRMVREADALVVFPGGRGTADVIRRAEKKGIPIYRRGGA